MMIVFSNLYKSWMAFNVKTCTRAKVLIQQRDLEMAFIVRERRWFNCLGRGYEQ